MGEQVAVSEYLRAMVAESDETKTVLMGADQGFHNFLYYRFVNIVLLYDVCRQSNSFSHQATPKQLLRGERRYPRYLCPSLCVCRIDITHRWLLFLFAFSHYLFPLLPLSFMITVTNCRTPTVFTISLSLTKGPALSTTWVPCARHHWKNGAMVEWCKNRKDT
jgi:hypothetical protein